MTTAPRYDASPGLPPGTRHVTRPTDCHPETIVGGGCECWVTPESTWTTHYGAVEPASQVQWNPDCPQHCPEPPETNTTRVHIVDGTGVVLVTIDTRKEDTP